MYLLLIWISDVIFAKIFCGCPSRPKLKSRLVQTVNGYFSNPDFRRPFGCNISWTSVKTLAMDPVGPNGDLDFRRHFCQKLSWLSVKTLAMELIGLDRQTSPYSWSNDTRSRFCGRPSRPLLLIRLVSMGKLAIFYVKRDRIRRPSRP
ncbi:hypothetical protein H5410_056599 [Solanum commersonii]|uniref:Uncharacterized protein n=1 Tax=Solanum commersonii TaxID=4109 RepID=A0A9J5WKN2_SOLCO|nr:hypothetical protein H5410_056599 [Solanum commersonii]